MSDGASTAVDGAAGETDPAQLAIDDARQILFDATREGGVGLLTTVCEAGRPHATWMGTFALEDWGHVVCLSSPESQKVRNIEANPAVEWLFSAPDHRALVYLEGEAEVLGEPAAIKRYWEAMPDKRRAYFIDNFNSGPGFAVVRTRVDSLTYCVPTENRKIVLGRDRLRSPLHPEQAILSPRAAR